MQNSFEAPVKKVSKTLKSPGSFLLSGAVLAGSLALGAEDVHARSGEQKQQKLDTKTLQISRAVPSQKERFESLRLASEKKDAAALKAVRKKLLDTEEKSSDDNPEDDEYIDTDYGDVSETEVSETEQEESLNIESSGVYENDLENGESADENPADVFDHDHQRYVDSKSDPNTEMTVAHASDVENVLLQMRSTVTEIKIVLQKSKTSPRYKTALSSLLKKVEELQHVMSSKQKRVLAKYTQKDFLFDKAAWEDVLAEYIGQKVYFQPNEQLVQKLNTKTKISPSESVEKGDGIHIPEIYAVTSPKKTISYETYNPKQDFSEAVSNVRDMEAFQQLREKMDNAAQEILTSSELGFIGSFAALVALRSGNGRIVDKMSERIVNKINHLAKEKTVPHLVSEQQLGTVRVPHDASTDILHYETDLGQGTFAIGAGFGKRVLSASYTMNIGNAELRFGADSSGKAAIVFKGEF